MDFGTNFTKDTVIRYLGTLTFRGLRLVSLFVMTFSSVATIVLTADTFAYCEYFSLGPLI